MVTQDLSRDFLLEKFREMATNVQAIVSHINTIQDVFSYAVGITTAQNGKTLAAAGFSENELKALELLCAQNGLEFLRPPFIERLNDIHTGLTPANWGIAETGTLVIDSVSEDLRIVTMLSESQVVCVSMANIKADSMNMEKILDQRLKNPPGYMAFITGASRTADIERVLTIGVHGPRELHILLVEENGS